MHVKHLIRKKYEVISPDVGVASVEDSLLKNSFLLVMEQDKYLGVLTTSDIVENPYKLVIDCLRDKPRIDPECEVEAVLALMKQSQNSVLPVFEGDKLIGVVIQDDIADFLSEYRKELEHEVAQRKQAEDTLRESEQKWRSLVENAPDVILTVKPDGTILFLNRTVPPFTPEKAVGTSVYDYVPLEYQQIMRDAFEQVVKTGEHCSYELAGCGPDGRTSWYQSRLGPIKKGGQVVALTLIATDVTEHKQAEIELHQSEHKYRTLLENLPQKIFLKDRNSVYLSCNENLAKDLKIKAEEIVGKTDYDLISRELAEKYRADDKRIMESGQTQDIEERYIQDGQEVIIHTVKTPVKDEQGNGREVSHACLQYSWRSLPGCLRSRKVDDKFLQHGHTGNHWLFCFRLYGR